MVNRRGCGSEHRRRSGDARRDPAMERYTGASSSSSSSQARGRRGCAKGKGKPTRQLSTGGGVLHLLPQDIVAQSIAPFLVWRENSALACVCKPWSLAVRGAKSTHDEWKARVFQANDPGSCVRAMASALGRKNKCGCVRFAPALAVVTISFASPESVPRDDRLWSELIQLMLEEDVIPVDCVVVGSLEEVSHTSEEPEEVDSDRDIVRLTVSMGVFPDTRVEVAAFDRKALRWSANGLTEELECPFTSNGDAEQDGDSRTSLLLWSANHKSSQALVHLVKGWFPTAPVSGAEVAIGSCARPIMTYTRVRGGGRVSKLQGRRKPKTTMESSGGVLTCPSAMVIRLQGRVFLEPFALCTEKQLTPILVNKSLEVVDLIETMGVGRGVYESVSTVAVAIEGTLGHRDLSTIISEALAQQVVNPANTNEPRIRLYTSMNPKDLVFASSGDHTRYRYTSVHPIYVASDSRGVYTVQDHWKVGEFGVVVRKLSGDEMRQATEVEVRRLVESIGAEGLQVFGGNIFHSARGDGHGTVRSARMSLGGALTRVSFHSSGVVAALGPIALPYGARDASPTLQVDAITGFFFCARA